MSHLFGQEPPPRSWRKLAWLALIVIGSVSSLIGLAYYQSNRQLREAMDQASRDVAHWRLEDVEAHRAEIPESQNSALHLMAAQRIAVPRWSQKEQELEDAIDDLRKHPAARLNEQQQTALVGLLAPYQPVLPYYDKIKDLPHGRYPLTLSPDVVSTLLPHAQ